MALAAAAAAAQPADRLPAIAIENPIWDFGEVEAGRTLRHVFRVGNRGSEPLRIHQVDSTCSCTVAGFDEEIAPGAVGVIEVDLYTDDQDGPFAVHLQAFTSDLASPEVTLTLKADVMVGLRSRPGYVRFVAARGFAEPIVDRQVVFARDGATFRVVGVEVPFSFLEASFREAEASERWEGAEGSQWIVEVRLLPTAPEGPIVGFVEVRTDHPSAENLSLPLSGKIRPPFEVHPEAADLGSFRAGSEHRTSVRIRSRIETESPILTAESSIAGVDAELVSEFAEDDLYFVVLRARPDLAAGEIAGTLTIRTVSEAMPEIRVPIRGHAL